KEKVQLGAVRSIRFKPEGEVRLHDGKFLRGLVAGLDAPEVKIDGKPVRLKLAEVVEVLLEPPQQADSVTYTLVVKQDGKEVARLSGPRGGAPGTTARPTAPAVTGIKPPTLGQDQVVKMLPATVDHVCVGGGGRFLILHLPQQRKLAVFDVNEAQVVKYLPVADDNVKFAAGMDKLIVALPTANVLQRWSFTTFEREVTVPSPVSGSVFTLAMGSASHGPLVVGVVPGTPGQPYTVALLDPMTFRSANYRVPQQIGFDMGAYRLHVSANGAVICGHGAL